MGGPGSGRKPEEGAVPYRPALTHKQRMTRHKEIAEYAAVHGVRKTAEQHNVKTSLIYYALRKFAMRAPRDLTNVAGTSTLAVLRRLYVDELKPAAVAAELGITIEAVRRVRLHAIRAGFVFDSNTEGTNE